MKAVARLFLALLAAVLVACGPAGGVLTGPRSAPTTGSGSALQELQDLAQLRAQFEQDAGRPRLLLLVSPT